MSAMFSTSRANGASAGSGASSAGANLVEFKAGRSQLQAGSGPSKKKVVSEKTKGTVFIKQSSDQLMHFCWKNRETGAVVDDLIIFPGDTEFKEVKGCPDGQVYMLKFKSSDERRLFWIQEAEVEKDLCQKVNDALNKPPQQRMTARGGSTERMSAGASAAGLAGLAGSEEMGALGGLDQQQLMQLLQFMNHPGGADAAATPRLASTGSTETGATPASGTEAAANASGNDQVSAAELSRFQQLLSSCRPANSELPATGSGGASVDLVDVVAGEKAAETVKNNEDSLVAHVPASEAPKQELAETVHAAQFKQASNAFGHALQTGQMAPVLEQFGVSEDAAKAAANGDLLEFAKKLTEAERGAPVANEAAASSQESMDDSVKEPEPKRGKTDDEEMDLD